MMMSGGSREDLRSISHRLLSGTQCEYIVSHPGRSQYSGRGGGVSACGLAVLNCARLILGKERTGMRGAALLEEMMRRETSEDILRFCLEWSSPTHLDVEDIYQSPAFRQSLKLVSKDYGQPGKRHFESMLTRMKEAARETGWSSCAVVTRPPEIVGCFYIAGAQRDLFAIFDSHPRPNVHPEGAAFIFKNSDMEAAAYLAKLLPFDSRILVDRTVQWEAQLLGQFSSHIFISREVPSSPSAWMNGMLKASLEMLRIRAECLELRSQKQILSNANNELQQEVVDLKNQLTKEQQRVANVLSCDPERDLKAWPVSTRRPSTGQETGPSAIASTSSTTISSVSVSSVSESPASHLMELAQEDSDVLLAARLQAEQEEAERQDFEFALMQQQAYDEENVRLRSERKRLARSDPGVFDCGVCFDKYSKEFVARVSDCGHRFCRECIRHYVGAQLESQKYPILCPLCTADNKRQEPSVLNATFMQQVGLSEPQYTRFMELELAAFSIVLQCRSCGKSIFVDKKEYMQSQIIVCPLPRCRTAWCKQCSQPVEAGGRDHSCDGSSELTKLMKQQGWKHCPGCQTPAEKISGCNHIACMAPACHTHFCYLCGESIIQSIKRQEINRAVSKHYSKCRLFEDIPDRPVPPA